MPDLKSKKTEEGNKVVAGAPSRTAGSVRSTYSMQNGRDCKAAIFCESRSPQGLWGEGKSTSQPSLKTAGRPAGEKYGNSCQALQIQVVPASPKLSRTFLHPWPRSPLPAEIRSLPSARRCHMRFRPQAGPPSITVSALSRDTSSHEGFDFPFVEGFAFAVAIVFAHRPRPALRITQWKLVPLTIYPVS
jgi:hypothetical protein